MTCRSTCRSRRPIAAMYRTLRFMFSTQDTLLLIPKRMNCAACRSVHEDAEMNTPVCGGQGEKFMRKRLALQAVRLLVSANLLYAAIFLKFAGVPGSVALFNHMSQAVHGLVSQSVFRLGSGAFETAVAILLLIPKTARLAAGSTVVWLAAVILSH